MGLPEDDLVERFRRVAGNNRVMMPFLQDTPPAIELHELQGRLNRIVYSSSESWMLPAWASKQMTISKSASHGEEVLHNTTGRNWITVGGVGSKSYAIMDETGLVTANRLCGSIDFWFEDKDTIIFPALVNRDEARIELYSPDDQLFEWKIFLGAIEVTRQIYHGEAKGQDALYNEIHIKNHSLNDTEFTFYVAVRPTSVRGVEPIESLEYDSVRKMTISNGYVALISDKPPSSTVLSAADNPNLLNVIRGEDERKDAEFSTAKGLATAVLKYRIRLSPAESKRYFFVSPLSGLTRDDEVHFELHTGVRDEYVGKWFDFAESTTNFAFPEVILDTAALQAKAILAQQVRSKLVSGIHSVTSSEPIEWARVLSALCRSGCLDLAKEVALGVARRWFGEGKDTSLGSTSPLIWGVLQYFHYSRDESFLRTISPLVGSHYSRMQLAIEAKMSSPEVIIPRGASIDSASSSEGFREASDIGETFLGVDEILAATAELREDATHPAAKPSGKPQFGLRDIISSLWDLASLRIGVTSLKALDMNSLAGTLQSLQADYLAWLESNSEKVYDEIVDLADDPDLSIASLDLLATIALLGKTGVSQDLEQWSLNTTLDDLMRRNLVMIPGPEKMFSSHLALRLAHYYVFTLRDYETWNILRRAIEILSEYDTLPEFVDPHSGAGRSGDGCSMLAAADLLILLREMIVSETESDIIVLPAIPDEWFTSTTPLLISRIPLSTGEIDVEVGASTNQHQIEVRMTELPNELEIHVPTYFSLPMVKLFGGGIVSREKKEGVAFIRALPLSTTIVATFHR